MNSLPSVQEMLGLLDTLKKTVREFVAREGKINGDLRVKTAAAHAEFTARGEQQESGNSRRTLDHEGKISAMVAWIACAAAAGSGASRTGRPTTM